jgi:hypothetical protein
MTNNNILDVLTYMFDYLFEVAEQDASQEIDDTAFFIVTVAKYHHDHPFKVI